MSSLAKLISFIFAVILGNILCAEVNRNTHENVWQRNWLNESANSQQFGKNLATTPWPALGKSNYQQSSNVPTSSRPPLWVRPNNGPNWVRNTPSPQRAFDNTGPSQTHSNNFVINERRTNNRGNNNEEINGLLSTGSVVRDTENFPQSRGIGIDQNNEISDDEIRTLSEELLNKDSNNPAQYISVNFQGLTTSRSTVDEAPKPLLSINPAAFSVSSISKLMHFYNNYIVEANQNEIYTSEEKNEENDFLDVVLSALVMQHARNFLIDKGKIGRDPQEFKELLRLIWFNMYSRGRGRIGSSGFEHVFLGELKNNQVSGLHNWVYFSEQEKTNSVNYLGYMKKIDLGGKGHIMKFHFTFHGVDKPVGSMFIGTSPELEMALYSICFIVRPDRVCPLKMNGNRFIIRTYTYRYKGKNMIGSAFPEI